MDKQVPVDIRKVMEALQETDLPPGRKYRKLTHLNRAEKALRRKLMNKRNSKLSRERKRDEVEELKETNQELRAENIQLKAENKILRERLQHIKSITPQTAGKVSTEGLDLGEQVPDRNGKKENVANQCIEPSVKPSFLQMIDDEPKFNGHLIRGSSNDMSIDFSIKGNIFGGLEPPPYNFSRQLSFGDVMGVGLGVTSSVNYQWNDIENVLTTIDSNYDWSEDDIDDIDELLQELRPSFDVRAEFF